jgi:hypothetical protein
MWLWENERWHELLLGLAVVTFGLDKLRHAYITANLLTIRGWLALNTEEAGRFWPASFTPDCLL